ncbi:hypothetical protein N566_22635, partial [Streptomycetaceae bacterium MP113-05]
TGAGSGIGAATSRRLAAEGHYVVLAGRRTERLEAVARDIAGAGGSAEVRPLDVTDRAAVEAFAASLDGPVKLLVNNAGGALGTEQVADADPDDWRTMFEVNVLGTLHVTQALLPRLEAAEGTVIVLSSTAAFVAYEGGGGYAAAKHGEHALAASLRLELCGRPVRVVEVAPGMVRTDEFALNRMRGDADGAAAVYDGVPDPLSAEDVADTIAWTASRPPHVNVDLLVVRPRAQAAQHRVHRVDRPDPRSG